MPQLWPSSPHDPHRFCVALLWACSLLGRFSATVVPSVNLRVFTPFSTALALTLVVVLAVADLHAAKPGADVKYVIRYSPGQQYFPGTVPQGIGNPLEGVAKVVAAFEREFPDTRVEVINTPNTREYLVTQLSGGAAADIVCVNVEEVWVDVQKQWYVPLDRFLEQPNPFVVARGQPDAPGYRQWWDMFRYQAVTRGKQAPDGGNYCLSLDMVETAIFYNKTFFAAHGLRPPTTWTKFITLLQAIKTTGKTPLGVNIDMLADWGQDLLFDQLYFDLLPGIDLYQDPSREEYLQGYLDPDELALLHQHGFFTTRDPRFVEVWRKLHELASYCNRDITPTTDLVRGFVNQQLAMIWNGSWFVGRLAADPNLGFDWGVFYLPQLTKADSPYASDVPMCVIGGVGNQYEITNTAVSDTDPTLPFATRIERSARLRRVVALLQFICLPENTGKIVNEFAGFIPNINGVPVRPELKAFERILERRYTTTKWQFSFDLRFSDILRRMLMLYLSDGIDLDGFLDWQVRNVDTATANFIRRKNPDLPRLEAAWQQLAPVRAGYFDLPEEPKP